MLGRAGQKVGRWRLRRPIGAGGMGQVWEAESDQEQRCALKLLAVDGTQEEELRRLGREGRALQRLHHPNVVQALDVGQSGEGLCYLAMEMLEGESLQQRLRRQESLSVPEALRIAVATASGLAAAHAAGIVHRDVKPGNVFLCSNGSVKLVDFGLALRVSTDPEDSGEYRLTDPGVVVGTPGYMSPEQIAGSRKEDERVDIWALGALLHRMLSGDRPFKGETQISEMLRITSDGPDPLPATVPANLAAVIHRALEKRPRDRFRSMARMRDALASTVEEEEPEEQTVPDTALRSFLTAKTTARGDDDNIALLASCRTSLGHSIGQPFTALRACRTALELQRGARTEKQRLLQRLELGACLTALGALQEAHAKLMDVVARARKLSARALESFGHQLLGLTLLRDGRPDEAIATLERAVTLARELRNPTHEASAAAFLSHCHWTRREAGPAERVARQAVAAARISGSGVVEGLARAALASALHDLSRDEEALAECTTALRLRDAAGGMLELEVHLFLTQYDVLRRLGRSEDATTALELAWRVYAAKLKDVTDPEYVQSYQENIPEHVRLRSLA